MGLLLRDASAGLPDPWAGLRDASAGLRDPSAGLVGVLVLFEHREGVDAFAHRIAQPGSGGQVFTTMGKGDVDGDGHGDEQDDTHEDGQC